MQSFPPQQSYTTLVAMWIREIEMRRQAGACREQHGLINNHLRDGRLVQGALVKGVISGNGD
ncbi:hypothetical protein [Acidisarcina polymorpha]|nr:hypothetical protein [Acidisarcina polymorpha]